MKYKNILNLALTFVVGLLFVACSQSDDESTSPSAVKMQNGLYVYDIDFNCPAPTYDAGTTRAVTYNWLLGQTMFARFNSGSSHLLGFIARTAEGWLLISTGDLLDTTSSGTCELYYFQEANGDYYFLNADTGYFEVYNNGSFVKTTDIKWNTASFSLSEGTAVYSTTTGTYTHKPSSWTAEATLTPMMWRMRFSGSNGTSITLPGSDNDIQYCSAFNWSWNSTSSAPSFTKAAKDVSLSVSGGYTPYIYGLFASTGSNKITVKNGNDVYTRNLNASSLPPGTSGYFDIPTSSNYSSKGWTKDVLYEIPCTEWGASKATVKTYMTNRGFTVSGEGDTYLFYNPKHREKDTYYSFDSNGLSVCAVTFDVSSVSISELQDFVLSLGAVYTSTSGDDIYYDTTDGKNTVRIHITEKEYVVWYNKKTSSNIDANATIVTDLLVPFTDGMVTNWKFGSTAKTFYYAMYTKSGAEALSDDELATKLYEKNAYTVADYGNHIFKFASTDFSPNTEYCLCAVATNSSGKRGPVLRSVFTTRSSNLPSAEVSDVTATSTNQWSCVVEMKYNAKSYYITAWTGESSYNKDWHFIAYYLYQDIVAGEEEAIDWPGVTWTLNSGKCDYFTICTWGVGSNGSIGNPSMGYGKVSSSAPAWTQKTPKSTVREETIPKADLEKMMKNTRLYRVTR